MRLILYLAKYLFFQCYALQNRSLGELHTDGDVVPTFGSGTGSLQSVWSSACLLKSENKCFDLLDRIVNEQDFFSRVITGDESWMFYYHPEIKRQNKERHTASSPRPKKAPMSKSKINSMLKWNDGE